MSRAGSCRTAALIGTGALITGPRTAAACSLCMDSMAYSAAPWLPVAFIVLLTWFIADRGIRMLIERHPMPESRGMPSMQTMIMVPLFSLAVLAFMGTAAFILIAGTCLGIMLGREVLAPRWPLVGVGRLLSIGALVLLAAAIAAGVWVRSRMTTFEVYDRFVWAGTRVSDSMSKELAADEEFDVELLRPMLESNDWHRADMAFYVLENRKDTDDLVLFADLILARLPETAPPAAQPWRHEDFYLNRWLERLDLQHISTREDLNEWLIRMETPTDEAQYDQSWSEP